MRSDTWTREEDDVLRALYAATPLDELSKAHLPGRSERSILTRASRLGLHKAGHGSWAVPGPPWTETELALLDAHYESRGAVWLRENGLGRRTAAAIMAKAKKRGLRAKPAPWTEEENDTLREHYGRLPGPELCGKLPGRSWHAVKCQAHVLGIASAVGSKETIGAAAAANGTSHGTNIGRHRSGKPLSTNRTTGIRGVCYSKSLDRYIAHISFRNDKRNIGYYRTLEEAVAARKAAEEAIRPELDRIAELSAQECKDILKAAFEKAREAGRRPAGT